MKPFDLEAAKRGEPICNKLGTVLFFIGVAKSERVVFQSLDTVVETIGTMSQKDLCMAPKKRTVWVNFYTNAQSVYHESEIEADNFASKPQRIGDKAYLVEIEE